MARQVKRNKTAVVKNNWKVKDAVQLSSGIFLIDFRNANKRARFNYRSIRLDTRAKKIEVRYEGRGGARKSVKPKYTAGWRKMAISLRGKFYK